MRMTETSIEKALRETPQPEPPPGLLSKLEMDLPAPTSRRVTFFSRFLLRPLAIGLLLTIVAYAALGIYIYVNLPPKRIVDGRVSMAYLSKKKWWEVFQRDLGARPAHSAQEGVPPTVSTPALPGDVVNKLFMTGPVFQRIVNGLMAYQADHQDQVPGTIEQLMKPVDYIGDAKDPFGTGNFKLIRQNDEVLIYSVGPDGVWDGGKPIDVRDPKLQGDFGIGFNIKTKKIRNIFDHTWASFVMLPVSTSGTLLRGENRGQN